MAALSAAAAIPFAGWAATGAKVALKGADAAKAGLKGVDALKGIDDLPPGTSLYRTPRTGLGDSELRHGLDPVRHQIGNRSAYVGSESVARDFANPKVGGYENRSIRYDMAPGFEREFQPYRFSYEGGGPNRWEYEIPVDKIDRFNELTVQRTPVSWE
jgi:hypothetical protein